MSRSDDIQRQREILERLRVMRKEKIDLEDELLGLETRVYCAEHPEEPAIARRMAHKIGEPDNIPVCAACREAAKHLEYHDVDIIYITRRMI